MYKTRVRTHWLFWGVFAALVPLASACAGSSGYQSGSDAGFSVPKDILAEGVAGAFIVTEQGVRVLDENGNPAEECKLCQRHSKECADAEAEKRHNICRALTRATVNDIIPATVIVSHRNPDCKTIKVFGKTYLLTPGCRH